MTQPDGLRALAGRIRAAAQAFAVLGPAVEAGRPWPLSEDFGHTPESYWGPGETLAHVAEMLPFWTGELERIVDVPAGGSPVTFGRTPDNVVRLGLIERDRSLPPRELVSRIASSAERLAARLDQLASGDAGGRVGLHATLGEMTAEQLVSTFVARHLEEHVEQLRGQLEHSARTG